MRALTSAKKRANDWLVGRSAVYRRGYFNRLTVGHARQRDPEENARTRPPADEAVMYRCLWVGEAFSLSMLPALQDALRSTPRGTSGFASDRDRPEAVARMLETATAQVRGASWAHLGRVTRNKWGTFRVDPPDGVSNVLLDLHIPFPSLALITAAFVFTDDRALEPNRLLTEDFSTILQERGGLRHPEWGKHDLIAQMRGRTLLEAGAWLREALHLEGTFALGALEGHQYPSMEWWTTRRARPFLARQEDSSSPGYMSALRFDQPVNLWEGDAFDGQVLTYGEPFTVPNDAVQLPSYSLVIAGREEDIFANQNMQFYGEGPEGWLNRMSENVAGLTAQWSTVALLRAQERNVAQLRTGLLGLSPRSVRRSVARLKALEDRLVTTAGDLLPLLGDLERGQSEVEGLARAWSNISLTRRDNRRTSSPAQPDLGVLGGVAARLRPFLHVRRRHRSDDTRTVEAEQPPEWVSEIAEWAVWRASRLAERLETLRSHHGILAATLTTRSNLRLQAQILAFTIVLGVVALVPFVLSTKHFFRHLWHLL